MDLLARLARFEPVWSGAGVAFAALVLALLVRPLLPASERHRGRGTLAVLALAVLLALAAFGLRGVPGFGTVAVLLRAAHVIALVLGVVGLTALVAFDIALLRAHVRVPSILRSLVQTAIVLAVLLWLWQEATDDVFSLVTTSAVLAVLGLALQGTIANLFAGLSLQLERTFQLGEWITVGGHTGKILEVRWRHTALATTDGDVVIVPNSELVGSQVVHLGGPGNAHRMACRIGFHYRHPPNLVRRTLLEAVAETPGVLAAPEPDCVVVDFADSAIVYAVRYWIEAFEREVPIASDVRTRIWYAAHRAGLEVPYPTRTIVPPVDEVAARATARDEHAAALERVALFAGLTPAERDLLASGTRSAHFAAGERIIRQGDPGDSCYLVSAGTVSVRLHVDGFEREVARLGPGALFGEMSLVTGEPRQASCVAVSDVVCRVVDQTAFHQVLEARPEVAEVVSSVLAARQAELDGEREGLSAAARTRREAETRTRLLRRIRAVFQLD